MGRKEDATKTREVRMTTFCEQNLVQLKSMKEVHSLIL